MHAITLTRRLLTPDDGLIIGNGELSVAAYQADAKLIFRFGKPDVWDRRFDRSHDPSPAPHIREIADGLEKEGWVCPSVASRPDQIYAKNGCKDERRLHEICTGSPDSYERRPTPCPKPVGELWLHLPPDVTDFAIEQTLFLEENRISIRLARPNGMAISVDCFVAPEPDLFGLTWKTEGMDETFSYGRAQTVWATLYRWRDPDVASFVERMRLEWNATLVPPRMSTCDALGPLPAPELGQAGELRCVRQFFPPEATFPGGFECLMTPYAEGCEVLPAPVSHLGAALTILPQGQARYEGRLMVGVTTSLSEGGAFAALTRNAEAARRFEALRQEALEASKAFFARSSFSCADELIEQTWYEALHLRRCMQLSRTVPPGLFFPCTLSDYTHWHGDYHMNYNLQQPYWGALGANHPELMQSYFRGIDFFLEVGEEIARRYYDCRGAFVQLTGYPMTLEDDPFPIAPLGRMAYMTGWASVFYWETYLYTQDRRFLAQTAYPAMKPLALFYLDFMRKEKDGLYHIFPSGQGEDGFDGRVEPYKDRLQVMEYAKYCLQKTALASEILGVDEDLRAQWRERLALAAGNDGKPPEPFDGRLSPEYGAGEHSREEYASSAPWPAPDAPTREWYIGHYLYDAMTRIRRGYFRPEEYEILLDNLARWRRPNGATYAMSAERYGMIGDWSEGLGTLGTVQELALQSWEGFVRLFPALPKSRDARFERFRAEGAFLVSAERKGGEIARFEVTAEVGGAFAFLNPYACAPAVTRNGESVPLREQTRGVFAFDTEPNAAYRIDLA